MLPIYKELIAAGLRIWVFRSVIVAASVFLSFFFLKKKGSRRELPIIFVTDIVTHFAAMIGSDGIID